MPQPRTAAEDHLTPIYPATEGVTQGRLRMLVGMALDQMRRPGKSRTGCRPRCLADSRLPSLRDALLYVHRPPADAPVELLLSGRHPAQRRLAFEELLAHQLSLKLLRRRIQSDPGWPLESSGALKAALLAALPFRLTRRQQRALAGNRTRSRAWQSPCCAWCRGTWAAARPWWRRLAATQAVETGRQVALMAPTELLGRSARAEFQALVRTVGRHGGSADRPADRQGARRVARRHSRGACRHRGRHSCTVSGERRVRLAGPGDRRRAASLRRAPAPEPAREGGRGGPSAASIDHDRDADSAHAGDDRLRRPRCFRDR